VSPEARRKAMLDQNADWQVTALIDLQHYHQRWAARRSHHRRHLGRPPLALDQFLTDSASNSSQAAKA
jgi:hypothetical protein